MTSLLLALALCWSPNTEPDLASYRVQFHHRYVVSEYPEFVWTSFYPVLPEFRRACADVPGSVCIYKHPTAMDTSVNESVQPMLLFPPPIRGECR